MTEKLERVARAICEAERMNPDDPLGGWVHWTEAAEAAIAASCDDLEFRIARVDLRPGDTLVIKYPKILSEHQRKYLMEAMETASGGHRVMVLDGGLDLAVMTAAEIAERSVAPQQDEDAA